MTSSGGSSADKGGGATDESPVSSVGDDNESLTTLDGRRGETLVALALLNSEGFTGKSGLIDLKVGILGNNPTVGRNNSPLATRLVWTIDNSQGSTYFLNLKNVTRNNLRSFYFLELTIAKNNSLESQSFLQLVDDGTGLEFLNETDGSVEQKKRAYDTEIDPIL